MLQSAPARQFSTMGLLYRAVAQPLLFRLEPERSHESTAALLRWCGALPGGGALLATLFGFRSPRLASRVCGVEFPHRKSTRLNSSHLVMSYAVLCVKKKNKHEHDGCTREKRS